MYVSSNVMSCLKSDKAKVFCTSLLVGHLNYYPGGNSDLLLPVLSSSATFQNKMLKKKYEILGIKKCLNLFYINICLI